MRSTWLILGILFAAAGVGIGAFGAHELKKHLDSEQLAIFETGVKDRSKNKFPDIVGGCKLKPGG